MARWVVQVAQALVPVWNVLSDRLITSFLWPWMRRKCRFSKRMAGRPKTNHGWVRGVRPYGDKKIVLFDYRISRSQEAARQLLDGITGYLQWTD
ncbi:MAG: transposase [Bdellovibrionales bacterium]|nr:transposase [Bdellovibrionales bacterium]